MFTSEPCDRIFCTICSFTPRPRCPAPIGVLPIRFWAMASANAARLPLKPMVLAFEMLSPTTESSVLLASRPLAPE